MPQPDRRSPLATRDSPYPSLNIAAALERRAGDTSDPRLRRILRVAGCDMIEAALQRHRPPAAV